MNDLRDRAAAPKHLSGIVRGLVSGEEESWVAGFLLEQTCALAVLVLLSLIDCI